MVNENTKLLLISNSTSPPQGYMDHCEDKIKEFLGDKKKITFIGFARPGGRTYDEYTEVVKERMESIGYEIKGIHERTSSGDNELDKIGIYHKNVFEADAFFFGGGNTFVLLRELQENNLLHAIRTKIFSGTPYIGTSAGINVVGKTMENTNDDPIWPWPENPNCLGILPFNFKPHYINEDEVSEYGRESDETRINEFHKLSDNRELAVVGLREGSLVEVSNKIATVYGEHGARIFQKDEEPLEVINGGTLQYLLEK